MKFKKCKNCKNQLVFKKRMYCDRKCRFLYEKAHNLGRWNFKASSINGRKGARKANRLHKIRGTGFYNSDLQRILGKRGNAKCKALGVGFYDPKIQSKGGKIGGKIAYKVMLKKYGKEYFRKLSVLGGTAAMKIQKEKKIGVFNPEIRKRAQLKAANTNKKNGTSICYDKKLQSKGGKAGVEVLRKNKLGTWFNPKMQRELRLTTYGNRHAFYFKGVYYDSNSEREFALNIYYQIEKIVLYKNYQFEVDGKHIDFFIKKYKCFIEYHPRQKAETTKQYFKRRRQVLDDNGYKSYKLLVITP